MGSRLMASKFEAAVRSISWAEEAVSELKDAADSYFTDAHTETLVELQANGEHHLKVKLKEPLPLQFDRKATEALLNAKHALDQATFETRIAPAQVRNKLTYFPWSQSPQDLDGLLKAREIDPRYRGVFRQHQPFPMAETHVGGDTLFRELATIANDKHTVGIQVMGTLIGFRMPGFRIKSAQYFSMPAPSWNPQLNEATLAIWRGEVEFTPGEYRFSFQLIMSALPTPVPALGALSHFVSKARQIIVALETAG